LRHAEAGTRVIEVCRKMGISEQTFFRWKKYGGLGASELRRLKQLEDPGIKGASAALVGGLYIGAIGALSDSDRVIVVERTDAD